jgi:hypothetical protein
MFDQVSDVSDVSDVFLDIAHPFFPANGRKKGKRPEVSDVSAFAPVCC